MKNCLLIVLTLLASQLSGQSNMRLTHPAAEAVLKGNYNAQDYLAAVVISNPARIVCEINNLVSPDSLMTSLSMLASFQTRHTFSDTLSDSVGIGAARRWIESKLQQYSQRQQQRLLTAYLEFDYAGTGCNDAEGLRNVVGILPGSNPGAEGIVIIEGHMDSRCEGRCDSTCLAPGVDDNASGTALVMELARVMSAYTFEHTLVFMLTTGEEQGLLGAEAMATYLNAENIAVKAVLNNDVVGGIVCGQTASPPGCAPPYAVDSTSTRIFANPQAQTNPSQDLARSLKLYYDEKIKSQTMVPMDINIINQLDRGGRGGDHIPFSDLGMPSSRFSSAHEHGDASVGPNYQDHQHTSDDVLGVDTTGDGILDTLYVNLNYLARNAVINGVAAAQLALGPEAPDFSLSSSPAGLMVDLINANAPQHRVGVRQLGDTEYEAIYRFSGSSFLIPGLSSGTLYYISVAALDSNEVMSPFSMAQVKIANVTTAAGNMDPLDLEVDCNTFGLAGSDHLNQMPGIRSLSPNPVRGQANIDIWTARANSHYQYSLELIDFSGRLIWSEDLQLGQGSNQLELNLEVAAGSYLLQLKRNGQAIDSRKVIISP